MDRTDFIENRIDVIKNIYTLYSYAKSSIAENKEWALQRFKQGKWYIVEVFGNTLFFAPSRFVGYKDNTIEKHKLNHGDGTQTNSKFHELKLYKEASDVFLTQQFEHFMITLGIEKDTAKFLIPYNYEISDLKKPRKCYFICPTHSKGQKENAWKSFLSKNIMAIGWKHTDYTNYSIEEIINDYTDDHTAIEPFKNIKDIKEGDIVCCTNNNFGIWGIGIALSQYKFYKDIHYAGIDEDGNDSYYSHYIDVAWICFKDNGYIPAKELHILSPEKMWQPYGTLNLKEEIPQYISNYILKKTDTNMEENNKIEKYIKLLEANKNIILTGAPGTGKTYLAKEIAKAMDADYDFVQFHPSYDYTDFVEGLRPTPPDSNGNIGFERKDGVFKAFCYNAIKCNQNPSVNKSASEALKAFKEELRSKKNIEIKSFRSNTMIKTSLSSTDCISVPDKSDWRATDEKMLNYIINNVCHENDTYTKSIGNYIKEHYMSGYQDESLDNNIKKFVFIIDEINRGEISKIFGELFFSIDPGYRGVKGMVKTQYQNMITNESDPFYEGFYIPENVYIIGTMNDIDRSVESMDFAMRRRFAWQEVKAEENTGMLDDLKEMKDEVIEIMKRLNNTIWNETTNTGIEGLNAAYHIGGSYFSKLQLYLNEDHTGNMAGFIGINGLSLSIHSRFSQDSKEDFFLHYMLSKVFCINVLNLSHGTSDEQLFDFLLYMFPRFLNEALSQGIYKEYKRNEYNDANVRGTININRHLRTNMPFNGRIAYSTREFSHDNHVTELIRHTIDYISKSKFGRTLLENDSETRTSVTQIISATPSYCRQEREIVVKSNLKEINHPYYSRYTPLQKLCLRILRHEKIKYGEKKNKIHGILFDVSYLWEEYLATILTKQGFKHPNNKKGFGCIYLAKHNRLPRYPDYYREYDRLIVDAKYKKETNRDDIHQMITYMYQMKGKRGIFVQPGDKEYLKDIFHLLGYGEEENAELQTYIYPISRITDSYKSFVSEMLKSEDSLKTKFKLELEPYQ